MKFFILFRKLFKILLEKLFQVTEDQKTHTLLQQYLFDKLNEYGITNDQIRTNVYFITDRGSNMKAMRDIGRFNCQAHLLNNVVQDMCGEEEVVQIIANVENLVKYLKKSCLNHHNDISVHQKSSTRWNSITKMFVSVVESYENIYRTLEERKNTGIALHKNCLAKIECIKKSTLIKLIDLLQPFKEWTDMIEGEKNVTIYHVWPTHVKMRNHLSMSFDPEMEGDADFQLIEAMKARGRTYIDKIEEDIKPQNEHLMAVALHPKMKKLRKMDTIERNEIYTMIDEIIRGGDEIPLKKSTQTTGKKHYLDEFVDLDESIEEMEGGFSSELAKYLKHQITNEDFLIENWWFENRSMYPNLFKLFLKISCVPASSAPSERTFSTAGRIINDRRTSLLPNSVESLLLYRNVFINK